MSFLAKSEKLKNIFSKYLDFAKNDIFLFLSFQIQRI